MNNFEVQSKTKGRSVNRLVPVFSSCKVLAAVEMNCSCQCENIIDDLRWSTRVISFHHAAWRIIVGS